jgi:hypothetical protein
MADAGLRWCGATLRQSNGGSHVKGCEEIITFLESSCYFRKTLAVGH